MRCYLSTRLCASGLALTSLLDRRLPQQQISCSYTMKRRAGGCFCPSPSPTLTSTLLLHNSHHPVPSSSSVAPLPLTLNLSQQLHADAAVKIQSSYRARLIRSLFTKISAVNSQTNAIQTLIQSQETVDAIRSSQIEKLKMNEALMSLLLKLDSVPGINPTLREARRKVSRRIVGLQEILDAISDSKLEANNWSFDEVSWNWDEEMAQMEKEICEERGGHELERYCANYLGFRCLQRFLREP